MMDEANANRNGVSSAAAATRDSGQPRRTRGHRGRRRAAGMAALVLILFILIATVGCSNSSVVWAAMPGRIGAPDTMITVAASGEDGPPTVRLAVLGDVGTGDTPEWDTAGLVAAAGANDPFDGLLLLGDNVYPDGDPAQLDATVFQPFASVLGQGTALFGVLGNHDVKNGNAMAQVEALGMPGRWYARSIGPVLLVVLDSDLVADAAQQEWLETTLSSATADWVIVAMHHPAFSAGYHGSTKSVQEAWVPLFERYGVDLVLAGHDHDYQRIKPMNGVTYIVSGGGASPRPTDRASFTAYAASVLHYVDISIWDDHLELTAYCADGPFDHVTIEPNTAAAASWVALADPMHAGPASPNDALGVAGVGAAFWTVALLFSWYGPTELISAHQRTVLAGTTIGMVATVAGLAVAAAQTIL